MFVSIRHWSSLWIILASVVGANVAHADSRAERPLQLQLDLYGASAGYHFSELVFIGVTRQSGVESRRAGSDRDNERDERIYDQDGVRRADFSFGRRESLELRLSPWEFGLYFALGALRTQGDQQKIVYDEQPRVVGDSAYNDTGMILEVKGQPHSAPAAGIGFNHVFEFGLSLGVGILVALTRPDKPEVTVTSSGSEPASDEDLEAFKKVVQDEYVRTGRGMLHLAVGFNF